MQVIVEYFMIQETTQSDLNDQINKYIKLGWQPLGGVSIGKLFRDKGYHYSSHASEGDNYCQAIVKYQDVPERQDPSPDLANIVFKNNTGTPVHLLKNNVTTPLNNDHRVMCGD